MGNGHLARLEKRVDVLRKALNALAKNDRTEEFLRIIRRPGFTTPAELAFVFTTVDAMITQVKLVDSMQTGLLKGSNAVRAAKNAPR